MSSISGRNQSRPLHIDQYNCQGNGYPILQLSTATAISAIAVLDQPYPTLYTSILGYSLSRMPHVLTINSYPASLRPTLHPRVAVLNCRIGYPFVRVMLLQNPIYCRPEMYVSLVITRTLVHRHRSRAIISPTYLPVTQHTLIN